MDGSAKIRELHNIADGIYKLTAAIQEQNELIKKLIIEPEEEPARIAIGICGAVEVIEL